MKILAIETSARAASCGWWEDGKLLAEYFSHAGLTHSQTIMPMVQSMLEQTGRAPGEADYFAVSQGPGSFTGLRIGIAAVKGLAMALQKPCVPVSTLHHLAWNAACFSGYILPVMDARCNQFYAAIFESRDAQVHRICPDEAMAAEELADRIAALDAPVMLVGDGAKLLRERMDAQPGHFSQAACANTGRERPAISPETGLYQRAGSLCLAAQQAIAAGQTCSAQELAPAYLRLPQAQRELLARRQKEQT